MQVDIVRRAVEDQIRIRSPSTLTKIASSTRYKELGWIGDAQERAGRRCQEAVEVEPLYYEEMIVHTWQTK